METSKISTSLEFWRLHDELTIVQAALLICDCEKIDLYFHVEKWPDDKKPPGYLAIKMALIKALEQKAIEGTAYFEMVLVPSPYLDREDDTEEPGPLDPERSIINVKSLCDWLNRKGIFPEFFRAEIKSNVPDYLNSKHGHYAPKLAAAVFAWEAVNKDPQLMRGKSAKQAMIKWLRQNAEQFNLTKDGGIPNELGIQEVAKVANWEKGGAPKTN